MTREEFEAVKSELTGLFRKSDLWSIGAKSFANLWRAVEYIGVILSSRISLSQKVNEAIERVRRELLGKNEDETK